VSDVAAVVVTYNRKEMLVECLDALARQTVPLSRVVLVDNASTDGTRARVEESGVAARLPIDYLRVTRNGGGAEGFHYGVRAALERPCEWLWLMDDDCEPPPDCLETLLGAAEPDVALLAPVVREPGGTVLPIHRGRVRRRFFFSPLAPLAEPDRDAEIDFCSFVGPLLRADAARRIGLPRREMFIRFEDVEYLDRLDERKLLVGASTIVHKEPAPVAGGGLGPRWREYRTRTPFSDQWKRLYGVRNQIFAGRRAGYMSAPQAVSGVLVQAVRSLFFHERPLRTLRLLVLYALDGWRGRFRNVPPGRWVEAAGGADPAGAIGREALRYEDEVTEPVRPLPGAPSRPTPLA
jgi:glycosyltransferase involved in cell wall biosynthesis